MRCFYMLLIAAFASTTAWAQTHFTTCVSNTGSNSSLVIPTAASPNIAGTQLATGDEIAVITSDGLCVGATVWTEGSNAAITIWGDNDQTPAVDGLRAGEQLRFRVWRQATNVEHGDSLVTYAQGNGMYSANGIYVLSALAFSSQVITGVDDPQRYGLPQGYLLEPNYPNPFNPTTSIRFTLPNDGNVTLKIYSLTGQLVKQLVSGMFASGRHEVVWNGKDDRGAAVASGIYFYRLAVEKRNGEAAFTETRRMALVK